MLVFVFLFTLAMWSIVLVNTLKLDSSSIELHQLVLEKYSKFKISLQLEHKSSYCRSSCELTVFYQIYPICILSCCKVGVNEDFSISLANFLIFY